MDEGPPSKVRKISHVESSTNGRTRRAVRACENCRASKLRCEAPTPLTEDTQCVNCLKTGRTCVYTDLPQSSLVGRGDEGDRLTRLEGNVSKLLDIFGNFVNQDQRTVNQAPLPVPTPIPTGSLAALTHLAGSSTFDSSSSTRDPQPWIPTSTEDTSVDNLMGFASLIHATAPISSTSAPSQQPPITYTNPELNHHVTFDSEPHSISPAGRSGRSDPIMYDYSHPLSPPAERDRYPPAQARPLPKVAATSRMAAFSDPSAHEAPFRPLTYNPDTYKNTEFSRQASEEPQEIVGSGTARMTEEKDGRKTPKRGRGDPIDRGVFTEEEARALFTFFHREILLFLPVLQEPVSFDTIRHRSSFLLSTILAISAKYCCIPNTPLTQTNGGSSLRPLDSLARHGVHPVTEDNWIQIRALAMSSFVQALISKVHCLEDVQATLLLCAYGLQDRGASPDPWIIAGSAYRLARRLGIHLAANTLTSQTQPSARTVASLQTYLLLYAFDRILTVGFGRPETEGFDPSTLDTSPFLSYLDANINGRATSLDMHITSESAACVVAYVELANIAREYSGFINNTLKTDPQCCWSEMERISASLDQFSGRWLRARSPLSVKLGLSSRPMRLLYSHLRLCLHSIPLKSANSPGSQHFLQRTRLEGNVSFLQRCLKKAQDSASDIVQAFVDDARDIDDAILCYCYDYIIMMLVHSASTLLRFATVPICDLVLNNGSGNGNGNSQQQQQQQQHPERVTAMRYCGMAITALVESNRSANRFPCDMACNLSLIARESGMVMSDWVGEGVLRVLEERGLGGDGDQYSTLPAPDLNTFDVANDFNAFSDFDLFLYPDFFENLAMFNGNA